MSGPTLGALLVGLVSVLIGAGWAAGAVTTRRRRAEIAATYRSSGGPLYTFVQLGCAGMLLLSGVALIGAVLIGGRR
jgi:hypothetical protein